MEIINKRYATLSINDMNELKEENEKLIHLIDMKSKTLRKSYGFKDMAITYSS